MDKYNDNSDKTVMNSHYLTLVNSHLRTEKHKSLYLKSFNSLSKILIFDHVQRVRHIFDLDVKFKGDVGTRGDTLWLLRVGNCTLSISWSNLILIAKVWSIVRPGGQYNFNSQPHFVFSI